MRKLALFIFGVFLAIVFQRLMAEQQPRPTVQSSAKPTPPRPSRSEKPARADTLTEIRGIGPAFEKALNAIGITTFAALAQQNADDLALRLGGRITAERIRREEWIEQARTLQAQ